MPLSDVDLTIEQLFIYFVSLIIRNQETKLSYFLFFQKELYKHKAFFLNIHIFFIKFN